ncbi:hypothetical protein VTJ04DRAFT_6459 [Mycothermus thermophilus]|uniref:uncharacterized protein n=1 Tax=Humicola insolens TaxID=85995 RepID=UPI003744B102
MPPRLPPTTRVVLCPSTVPPSPFLLPPRSTLPPTPPTFLSVLRRPPPSLSPTRPLTTTSPRPFLLSALANLAPDISPGRPPPPKTLRAHRILPYPADHLYTLIADIDSYKHFLPHCPHSLVTHWTKPLPTPQSQSQQSQPSSTTSKPPPPTRHPARADLTVGWGPFTQTYTSRVYCVPGQIVEAVSGAASTTIPWDVLARVGYEPESDRTNALYTMEGIFESLVTRWTVKPLVAATTAGDGAAAAGGTSQNNITHINHNNTSQELGGPAAATVGKKHGQEWTEVTLSVTFQFKNPALGYAVGQLADEKVDEMVKAFEGRARELYGRR